VDKTRPEEYEVCCKRGDVSLPAPGRTPPFLKALLTGQDAIARTFRQNLRSYNSALAFTSFAYNKDQRVDLSSGGI